MASNAQSKSELSDQDLDLINLLQWAPRITWGEAAEILEAHPTTLAGRWEKLRTSGLAWLTAQVSRSDSRNLLSFQELSCDAQQWGQVVEELVAMPEVLSVEAFGREPDLGLTVVSRDLQSLSHVIEERISRVQGVVKIHNMISTKLHRAGDKWRLDRLTEEQIRAAQAWVAAEQESLPAGGTPLTEDQRPVIEALMLDGRASAAEIARTTGLHPATARRYLHKVLASGLLSIRCDLNQQWSAAPITTQWFTRLDANQHEAAADALSQDPRTRVVSSITGRANLMVVMWLSSVGEILEAECAIQAAVAGIEIQESVVSLRPIKRMGWVLGVDGHGGKDFISPRLHLG